MNERDPEHEASGNVDENEGRLGLLDAHSSPSTIRRASCLASVDFSTPRAPGRRIRSVPAFRLGLPSPDEPPIANGEAIEVAPLSVRVQPGELRRGWPVGRLVSMDAEGIIVAFEATGRTERYTWEERGLGWRRARS